MENPYRPPTTTDQAEDPPPKLNWWRVVRDSLALVFIPFLAIVAATLGLEALGVPYPPYNLPWVVALVVVFTFVARQAGKARIKHVTVCVLILLVVIGFQLYTRVEEIASGFGGRTPPLDWLAAKALVTTGQVVGTALVGIALSLLFRPRPAHQDAQPGARADSEDAAAQR